MKSDFNIIANKLLKNTWKIINNDYIKNIVMSVSDEIPNNAKIHKTSHNLKNKWYLLSLKKDCFIITHPNKIPDEDEIILLHYRDLLRKHCKTYLNGKWYIGWLKALELHLQNYEPPETIEIVNTEKSSLEVIVFEKTVNYKKYTIRNKNLLTHLKKYIITIKIWKYNFPIAPLELSMLEALHNPSAVDLPLINEYIKKLLRKHKKTLNLHFFETILTYNKHHVGANRIYQLCKSIDPVLAEKFHRLLKKYSFVM